MWEERIEMLQKAVERQKREKKRREMLRKER
jgi:hypothetical protein